MQTNRRFVVEIIVYIYGKPMSLTRTIQLWLVFIMHGYNRLKMHHSYGCLY